MDVSDDTVVVDLKSYNGVSVPGVAVQKMLLSEAMAMRLLFKSNVLNWNVDVGLMVFGLTAPDTVMSNQFNQFGYCKFTVFIDWPVTVQEYESP